MRLRNGETRWPTVAWLTRRVIESQSARVHFSTDSFISVSGRIPFGWAD